MSLYAQRGVSAQKEEVHRATEKLDQGLYPNAFCKIYPDYLGGDAGWVNLMHAGWPYLQETIAMLLVYPQVYVDVGAIAWLPPM